MARLYPLVKTCFTVGAHADAHAQVLALADQVVDAVKSGAIKKFVVMAGCDGRAKSREYYTEFAKHCRKML